MAVNRRGEHKVIVEDTKRYLLSVNAIMTPRVWLKGHTGSDIGEFIEVYFLLLRYKTDPFEQQNILM